MWGALRQHREQHLRQHLRAPRPRAAGAAAGGGGGDGDRVRWKALPFSLWGSSRGNVSASELLGERDKFSKAGAFGTPFLKENLVRVDRAKCPVHSVVYSYNLIMHQVTNRTKHEKVVDITSKPTVGGFSTDLIATAATYAATVPINAITTRLKTLPRCRGFQSHSSIGTLWLLRRNPSTNRSGHMWPESVDGSSRSIGC